MLRRNELNDVRSLSACVSVCVFQLHEHIVQEVKTCTCFKVLFMGVLVPPVTDSRRQLCGYFYIINIEMHAGECV